MEDNPLYLDICYALSILNKFQPYFSYLSIVKFSEAYSNMEDRISSFL